MSETDLVRAFKELAKNYELRLRKINQMVSKIDSRMNFSQAFVLREEIKELSKID